MSEVPGQRRVTTAALQAMKGRGERISALTGYDHFAAQVLDEAGVDVILVGDTLGMTMLGYDTTLPVTMEEMLHHARAVARGASRALVVGDMPFGSYQGAIRDGVHNAIRFVKEAGAGAVKLEGGRRMAETVEAIVQSGVPVMAHIGFRPQEILVQGGYRVVGRDGATAGRLRDDAAALEGAGAFAVVLECIPTELAGAITRSLQIPTIGIGAGPDCDGQVLVWHDMLGMFPRFKPRYVKRYAELHGVIAGAVQEYIRDVRAGRFPDAAHSYRGEPPPARAQED